MYLILMIIITLLLGSIGPLLQFVIYNRKLKSQPSKYHFSQTLLDFDMDSLSFENIDDKNEDAVVCRLNLSDRGWIRCPQGTVMSERDFGEKKKREFELELP